MQYINAINAKKKGDAAQSKFNSERQMTDTQVAEIKDAFARCDLAAGATDITCNTNNTALTAQDQSTRLCRNLFSMNNANGYVEGDDSFDEGLQDNDVNTADTDVDTPAAKRILQAASTTGTDNFNVGFDVAAGGTAAASVFGNLNAADSAVVPDSSIDTADAGDDSFGKISAVGASLLMILATLF